MFLPGIASGGSTPRWAFLAVLVPIILFSIKVRLTLPHIFLGLLISYGALSFFWSTVGYDWALEMSRFLIVFGLFLIGSSLQSLRPIIIGCAIGLAINSIVVIAQVYGWQGIQQTVSPGGLFLNKNLGGEIAALILIGALYERIWWAIPLVLPSFILPHSRGSYAAFGAVALLWAFQKHPKTLVVLVSVAVFLFGYLYIIYPDGAVAERFSIWADVLDGSSWFGHGLGQLYSTYPEYASRVDTLAQRPEHAHNDLLELWYDLGIGSIVVIAFVRCLWRGTLQAEKAILVAFFVEGLFNFPLYMPATAALFALVAGSLAGSGPSLRDDINACRSLFRKSVAGFARFQDSDCSHENGRETVPIGIQDTKWDGICLRSGSQHGSPARENL